MGNQYYDAPIPGGPLTTRQPAKYAWMSGNLPDTHENRAESPLYGELYPDTSPVPTSITIQIHESNGLYDEPSPRELPVPEKYVPSTG